MPAPLHRSRLPKYRHYKPKDLAVVRIDGRDIYLGKYDSPESREKYRRVIAEWLSVGKTSHPGPPDPDHGAGLTVTELIVAFWTRFAETHYRRADGSPTGELDNFRDSLRPLRQLYGHTAAKDFGPLALKAVRQSMIESGLARTTINQRVGRVVRVFKWAVENELVPPAVHQGLSAVRGLQKGRSPAREPGPVRPVSETHVESIRPYVARQVWAMIELQRLTGMRPGEVCRLRACDLDTSGSIWAYRPASHKTEHHGRERIIFIGPQAQLVLRPWLRTDLSAYLFSPREAVEERLAQRRRERRTPLTPSQRARVRKRYPGRAPGECYTTRTYHHAIKYGCRRAGIPAWHPNQLRHDAATRLRRDFGLDVARVILGHSSPAVTEIYAEVDRDKAIQVVGRVG